VAASKLELKALEERLRDLIDRRNARVQQLDEFNDLYFSRLGPLMQQILALRKTLAELNLRRQQAEARRREEDYRRCQQYGAGGRGAGNAHPALARSACRLRAGR
jgi:uncharacterized protein YydD (DUF2326 family)